MSIRSVLETLYEDTCDIYGYEDIVEDGVNKGQQETLLYEAQPCRVSFSTIKNAEQYDTAAETEQTVKLFISPDVQVKEGCRIVIERDGEVLNYRHSGKAAVYPTHREIMLVLEERWA
ncbi:MAG: hypothetical protein IKS17_02350 [Firmicutes bacterium]|nr:hypothetical protein [Bacillota bacterium]